VSHYPANRRREVVQESVGAVADRGRSVFLGLFLDLVSGTGATGRADGATDDGAGRPGDRPTDEGAGSSTTEGTGPGTGLVIALGRLTGDRTGNGTDRSTDDSAGGSTDGHADSCATERAGASADCFGSALFVLRGRAVRTKIWVRRQVVMRVCVRGRRVVVVHWGPP
jgi:hypothetical protein